MRLLAIAWLGLLLAPSCASQEVETWDRFICLEVCADHDGLRIFQRRRIATVCLCRDQIPRAIPYWERERLERDLEMFDELVPPEEEAADG